MKTVILGYNQNTIVTVQPNIPELCNEVSSSYDLSIGMQTIKWDIIECSRKLKTDQSVSI